MTDLGGWDEETPVRFARAGIGRSMLQRAGDDLAAATSDKQRQANRDYLDSVFRDTMYAGNLASREAAREDAYDAHIEKVRRLTGAVLENPLRGGYAEAARVAARGQPGTRGAAATMRPAAEAEFQRRLKELSRANRDVATDLAFDPDTAAIGLAQRAAADVARTAGDVGGIIRFGGGLGAGIAGSYRDPLFWGTLFVGPEMAVGRSIIGNIARSALKQGAFNAAVTAIEQPAVQSWRAEIGAESGVLPALEEIGWGALAGAVPGAVLQGGIEAATRLPALRRVLTGAGDAREASQILAATDSAAAKEAAPALAQAAQMADADAALLREVPDGVTPAAHARASAEVTRHLDAPDAVAIGEAPRPLPAERPALKPLKDGEAVAAGARVSIDGRPAAFERFDATTLSSDAATFQYKGGGDAAGVTDRLKGVTRWDPLAASKVMVFERLDGTRVVADGHQRLGLARRLLADGRESAIALDGFLFKEADGWTPADVRALAARKNMQEGSGDALDAARVLRDRPDLADGSLPVTAPMMRQALGLSRLSDDAFGMALNGVVPPNHAAAIGALAPDPATHAGLMADLARAGVSSEAEARFLIGDALASGFRVEEQINLFGASEATRSLLPERAKVLTLAIRQLESDAKLFGTLANRADVIEAAGNTLDRAGNELRAGSAAGLVDLIAKLAQRTGPVSDALSREAARLAQGLTKPAAAARAFSDKLQATLEEGGLKALLEDPRLAPGVVVEPGTPQALAAASTPDLLTPDLLTDARPPDLFDAVPMAARDDGRDVVMLSRAALEDEARLLDDQADLVDSCKS